MNSAEQRQAVTRPQLMRLKDLGTGYAMKRVLADRVLIAPIEAFTDVDRLEKEGLIYAPTAVKDTNKPMPTTGKVIMVGPEVPLDPLNPAQMLVEGDVVMFSKYAGMDIELNGESFKLLRYAEIACVIQETDPGAITLVAG